MQFVIMLAVGILLYLSIEFGLSPLPILLVLLLGRLVWGAVVRHRQLRAMQQPLSEPGEGLVRYVQTVCSRAGLGEWRVVPVVGSGLPFLNLESGEVRITREMAGLVSARELEALLRFSGLLWQRRRWWDRWIAFEGVSGRNLAAYRAFLEEGGSPTDYLKAAIKINQTSVGLLTNPEARARFIKTCWVYFIKLADMSDLPLGTLDVLMAEVGAAGDFIPPETSRWQAMGVPGRLALHAGAFVLLLLVMVFVAMQLSTPAAGTP